VTPVADESVVACCSESAVAISLMADDPYADYLMVFRVLVVIPVNGDGLMEGEDSSSCGSEADRRGR
jgi:hypothetical protein